MKAEIDEKGQMTIIAESPLESFALNVWMRAYIDNKLVKMTPEDRHTVFKIKTTTSEF